MGKPLAVLIVEDSESDAQLIVRLLHKAGHEFTYKRVETSEQMRLALETQAWDVVISDYSLPQFDGSAALALLHALGLDIPFIAVSGTIGEETAVAMMKAGARDYLMKGNLTRLGSAIERELEQAEVRRERKQVEENSKLFRALADQANDAIEVLDPETGRFLDVNEKACVDLGYTREELLALSVFEIETEVDQTSFPRILEDLRKQGALLWEGVHRRKNGSTFPVEVNIRYVQLDRAYIVSVVRDISNRKQAEEALRESEQQSRRLLQATDQGIYGIGLDDNCTFINQSGANAFGFLPEECIGRNMHDLVHHSHADGSPNPLEQCPIIGALRTGEGCRLDNEVLWRRDGTSFPAEYSAYPIVEAGQIRGGVVTFTDITARKQGEAQILRQVETLGILYSLSRGLAEMEDFDAILDLLTRQAVEATHVTFSQVLLLDNGDLVARAVFPVRVLDHNLQVGQRESLAAHPFCQRILEEDTPRVLQADSPEAGDCAPFFLGIAQTLCFVPLRTRERPLGLLILGEVRAPAREPFTEEKVRLARSIADQAGSTLHRALLYEATVRQLDQLRSLHNIDQTISSTFDLRMTLNVILEQVAERLHVDATDVLLLNPYATTLEYAAGRGFRTREIEHTRMRLGEGQAGRVALERHTLSIPDLAGSDFLRPALITNEGFVSYCATPLIAKGQVKGVLEVLQRAPLEPEAEWLEFLETLASQAAIAIEETELFEGLQRSNAELGIAYDSTIEGWSHALDLRDKETEGHTQRVTEITQRLARAAGVAEAELVHIRRGALLHDIGKMGVPDGVLLKPGPLTDEEWVIMRNHPQVAYDMLSPIAYLKPALDIPYCHHEKWDGTGYPRGLKGEQIPLAARLFSIVDVWDALRSDRPYRKAWPEEKVMEHIKAGSGTHFDPQPVELFLKMMSKETEGAG